MYSFRTKEGNYSEDAMGRELVKSRKVLPLTYKTETTANYIPPREMDGSRNDRVDVVIESVHDLKLRNKEGLSYHLLFDHGLNPKDRFISSRAIPEGTLYHEKLSRMRKELNMGTHLVTQTRLASALMRQFDGTEMPELLKGLEADALPDFRRTFKHTDTIPVWM